MQRDRLNQPCEMFESKNNTSSESRPFGARRRPVHPISIERRPGPVAQSASSPPESPRSIWKFGHHKLGSEWRSLADSSRCSHCEAYSCRDRRSQGLRRIHQYEPLNINHFWITSASNTRGRFSASHATFRPCSLLSTGPGTSANRAIMHFYAA